MRGAYSPIFKIVFKKVMKEVVGIKIQQLLFLWYPGRGVECDELEALAGTGGRIVARCQKRGGKRAGLKFQAGTRA